MIYYNNSSEKLFPKESDINKSQDSSYMNNDITDIDKASNKYVKIKRLHYFDYIEDLQKYVNTFRE